MYMWFDLYTIKEKIYKKLIQDLCQVSDCIYFTSDREYTIDEEGIHGVEGECERADNPPDVIKWCTGDVVGYKIDAHMMQYLYSYNNLNQLLGDRMSEQNKTIFFYSGTERVAHIYNNMFKLIHIVTDEERIIRDFSPLSHGYV